MADRTDDKIAFGGAGNGDFIAIFVLLVIFAFGNAVHLRFVQGIDFILVFWLLREHSFIKQEFCLMAFE